MLRGALDVGHVALEGVAHKVAREVHEQHIADGGGAGREGQLAHLPHGGAVQLFAELRHRLQQRLGIVFHADLAEEAGGVVAHIGQHGGDHAVELPLHIRLLRQAAEIPLEGGDGQGLDIHGVIIVRERHQTHPGRMADQRARADVEEFIALFCNLAVDGHVVHMPGKAQVHALVRQHGGDEIGVLHHDLAPEQPEQRHAGQQRVVVHGDHDLTVLPSLCGLLQDPFDLPRGIGVAALAVAVVIQRQKPETGRELRHVGEVLLVHGDGVRKAVVVIQIEQLAAKRALGLVAAGLVEAEGGARRVLEIVPGGDHENALAVRLQLPQKLDELQMALLFAVKGEVARDQHGIGKVRVVQPPEGGAVDGFGFGKAFLLGAHEFLIRLAPAAELGGEIVRVGNQ